MNISIPLYPEGNDDKTVATSIKNIIHMKLEKKIEHIRKKYHQEFLCRFSVSIDATKLAKTRPAISYTHQRVYGYARPNHSIDISNSSTDEVSYLVTTPRSSYVFADEIKIALVTFQDVPLGDAVSFAAVGLPQTIHEANRFNDDVVNACTSFCDLNQNTDFISVAADGVSVDATFIRRNVSFWLSQYINIITHLICLLHQHISYFNI